MPQRVEYLSKRRARSQAAGYAKGAYRGREVARCGGDESELAAVSAELAAAVQAVAPAPQGKKHVQIVRRRTTTIGRKPGFCVGGRAQTGVSFVVSGRDRAWCPATAAARFFYGDAFVASKRSSPRRSRQ